MVNNSKSDLVEVQVESNHRNIAYSIAPKTQLKTKNTMPAPHGGVSLYCELIFQAPLVSQFFFGFKNALID